MTEPVLRVLISKSELDHLRSELKKLQELHKNNSKTNLTKDGSGSNCVGGNCESAQEPCNSCRDKDPVPKENPLVEVEHDVPAKVDLPERDRASFESELPSAVTSSNARTKESDTLEEHALFCSQVSGVTIPSFSRFLLCLWSDTKLGLFIPTLNSSTRSSI